MGYAELIERLQTLSEDKQAEVFDFVEFLANRSQATRAKEKTLAESSIGELVRNPVVIADFIPLSREEANAR